MSPRDRGGLTRRDALRAGGAGVAGLSLLGLAACDDDEPRAQAPAGALNVVLLIVDSLRVDHVYGPRARTRTMDALAREGLRFTNVHPEAMPTIPARRSIMEGGRIFPFRGWKPIKGLSPTPGWRPIGENRETWTELLRDAGWTTGYVTDNPHILSSAHKDFRGTFDRVDLVSGQVPLRAEPKRRVSQAELYKYVPPSIRGTKAEARMREYLAANPPGRPEGEHLAARVYRRGMDWLEWAQTRQPFALVVDTFDAHEPWDAPANLVGMYAPRRTPGIEPIQPFPTPAGEPSKLGLSPALVERMAHLYAAELTLVDRWMGHLLDRLANLGMDERTLVVLISDHGVLLGEYGWVGKRYTELHNPLVHVPMIIRHPSRIGAGVSSSYNASTHDIGPTVLAQLGVPKADHMDGVDLSPLLGGARPPRRNHYTAAYANYVIAGDARWHLISDNQGKQRRLFDKRSDPRELRDVAASYPAVVKRLWGHVLDDAGGPLPKFG